MAKSCVVKRYVGLTIQRMFPVSVSLGWNGDSVVFVHYCERGDEDYVCIRDMWWKFVNRLDGYEFEGEWVYQNKVVYLEQVAPPEGVTYSCSNVVCWGDESFRPTSKSDVKLLIESEEQYSL